MPQASVVMSTYNRAHMLPSALTSALGQLDVGFELIVVDNGSQDHTAEVLTAVDDPRLRVVRNEESRGGTGGRNTGLALAAGDWVTIHDDDDLWAPTKLRKQLAAATEAGRDWAFVGCVYIDGDGRVIGGRPPVTAEETGAALPTRYVVPGGISNVVWRREVLDEGGLLDDRLSLTADWDLSLRLLRRSLPAVVAEPLVAYRQHASNMSQRAGQFQAEFSIIEEKFADLRDGRQIHYGLQERFLASELLRAGQRREAAAAYVRGVRKGDLACLIRAPALLAPASMHPWLRRTFRSHNDWMAGAQQWLDRLPATS